MTTAEDLWKTLEDLTLKEFKQFKWFLKQDVIPGFPAISVAQLEPADRQDTVDLMEQQYSWPGALEITMKILEKIKRNDLVESLLHMSSRPKDLRSHNPAPLSSNDGRKKATLVKANAEIQLMIQERERKILEIKRSAEFHSKSADRHIADGKQVYADLQQAVERSLATLIEAIEEKRETMRKEAEGIIQELNLEISELTNRRAEMEQLLNTEDQPDLLILKTITPTKDWTDVSVPLPSFGGSVGVAVNELEEIFKKEKENLTAKAKLKRAQQFAKDVSLDPKTANRFLVLSDDGKMVHCGDVERNLPDNPERFNTAINVLGKQSFSSGRFYYEVEVKGKTSWDLGVVKESINRKGSITAKPENGFWTLCLRTRERNKSGSNHVKHHPKKVGVLVDYEKGLVSFFDVDSAEVLLTFTDCSFTGKLYPFFSPGLSHNGTNSKPLTISAVT